MAIEILERGTHPKDKVYEERCHGCKSLLRFARQDADYVTDQRDGDYVVVSCPVCDRKVYASA